MRHLRNAPVIEALIDFRVKARSGFQAEEFGSLRARLADRLPKVNEHRGVRVTLGVIKGQFQPPVSEAPALGGYFFKNFR